MDKSGGKSMQKDVETYLEVSHPTVVGLLSGLESRGLVSCVFDSDDKRMKSVYLTDEGSALFEIVAQRRYRRRERILERYFGRRNRNAYLDP
ncbi:MAG: hypothetical protein L6V85_04040 [Clostridiales bacterium]|nr:MAG: hypothetical protein L6V85_04040 [Clostridiales bacterium]